MWRRDVARMARTAAAAAAAAADAAAGWQYTDKLLVITN